MNLLQNLSEDEKSRLKDFNDTVSNVIDELSKKKFGSELRPAVNWMLLQSLPHPGKALEMFFADDNFENLLRMINDNSLKHEVQNRIEKFTATFLNRTLYKINSIGDIMSVLWYSKLPCFDIDGITSEVDGEASLLKLCKWKGKKIPCHKIFMKVTTDQGICCAFNMEEADKIFVESTYTTIIKNFQREEDKFAFKSTKFSGWEWYLQNKEPKSQSGNKMGLTVILDAHTDLISEYTISTDYKEITAAIIPPGDFPLTSQNPIKIKPGHSNMIALVATHKLSDPAIKTIDPVKRKCYFRDETNFIKFHKNYSQMNCLFECALFQARKVSKINCTPWFFPQQSTTERVCDPWEKSGFIDSMQNDVASEDCEHCLPDCDQTMYQPMVTTQQFRVCNEKNFGMSELCSLDSIDIWPQIWANQVLHQINRTAANLNLIDVINKIKSSNRTDTLFIPKSKTFTTLENIYDAYKDDIAEVSVYFPTPTVMKFSTRINKTWIDFISGIGGNVGLFIGFSFVTIFELLWLLIRVLWLFCQ